MTMNVNKGQEFPVVELPGVGQIPAARVHENEAGGVFYVGATGATQRLVFLGGRKGWGWTKTENIASTQKPRFAAIPPKAKVYLHRHISKGFL